ncbi:MAG TPA: hypothetical protein DDY78_22785 [Planctomycetales bacterium]|jgi:hypothetical protein|nr:hypothetical protein [Planctomycetales bacterium]
MLRIHVLAVAAGVLALIASASSVQAKAGGKKDHGIHGVVMSIDKDGGTITVKTGGKKHKKTSVETPVVERTFKVTTGTTTFTKVSHKPGAAKGEKGSLETTAATFDQLKMGDHVSIVAKDDAAVEVKFHAPHHKKKAA